MGNGGSDRKIKVVEIIEATTGGTRRHLYYLLTQLDPKRFSLSLIYSNARDPYFAEDLREFSSRGIRLFEVPMRREISPFRDLAAFLRILRILRRERWDLVHAHSSKAGFLGRLAARIARVPCIVYSPHSFAFQYEPAGIRGRTFRLLERLASRLHHRLLCVSNGERRVALDHSVGRSGQIEVIENAIPEPAWETEETRARLRRRLGIPDSSLVVGTVAQFRPQKGLNHLLGAIPPVLLRYPSAFFVLVGSGPLLAQIRKRIRDLGIGKRVILAGHAERIWGYYQLMDVFVLASLWEGMPYAILEAMAARLPIVATDTVGNNELVEHERNGFLVAPGDPAALAEAIGKLLDSESLRRSFGGASRLLFQSRLTMKGWTERYRAFYETQASSRKNAAPPSPRTGPFR